jgi:hypothetical protein
MTDPHRPDPAFVDRLVDRIETEDRRLDRFHSAPARTRRRFPALSTILVIAVLTGSVGVVAAGKLDDAERKRLLAERARIVLDTAGKRKERLEESLGEAKRSYEAGFVGKSVVERAALRVELAGVTVERHRLELAEIEASGRPVRDDVAAPRVGERDFVGERLRLDLEAVELRIAATKAERDRRPVAGPSGFSSQKELEETRAQLEARWRENLEKAKLLRTEAEAAVATTGLELGTLELRLAALRKKSDAYGAALEEAKLDLARRAGLEKEIPDVRKALGAGEEPDVARYGEDERIPDLRAELAKAKADLERLRRELGPNNPKILDLERKIEDLRTQIFVRSVDILDRFEQDGAALRSSIASVGELSREVLDEYAKLDRAMRAHDQAKKAAEVAQAEADRVHALLDKLRVVPTPAPPDREPPAASDDDPGRRLARLELEAAEVRRRLAIRAEVLDGKADPDTATLREDRSAAARRLAEAELELAAAQAELTRLKKLASMGLATRSELREAEGRALDLETEVRVAKIDIAILDDRLSR